MNELVQQLKSRVGLDDQKAQSSVQVVVEFLKQRLPASVAPYLDNAVSGGTAGTEGTGGVEGIKDKVSGMFGKKTA